MTIDFSNLTFLGPCTHVSRLPEGQKPLTFLAYLTYAEFDFTIPDHQSTIVDASKTPMCRVVPAHNIVVLDAEAEYICDASPGEFAKNYKLTNSLDTATWDKLELSASLHILSAAFVEANAVFLDALATIQRLDIQGARVYEDAYRTFQKANTMCYRQSFKRKLV